MSELKCPLNDARGMGAVLREQCGFDEVEILLDEEATNENIKTKVYDLAEGVLDGQEDELLLFYFSGHGVRVEDAEDDEDTYLVSRDFNRKYVIRNSSNYLSTKWLREQLYLKTRARKVLIVLDCCYSGMISETGEKPGPSDIERFLRKYLKEVAQNEAKQEIGMRGALCTVHRDETATEGEEDEYSLMTGLMLKLLQGQEDPELYTRPILLESVMAYLRLQISSKEKQPVWCGAIDELIILADHRALAQGWVEEKNKERERRALGTNTLPRGFMYVPVSPNPLFKKEEQDFAHLERLLFPDNGPARLGLVGMPGIGKSQLAAQLAYAYRERFPEGIFWVSVQGKSEAEWRVSFVKLAQNIGYLPPGGEQD